MILILFLLTLQYTVWPGVRHLHKWPGIDQGAHALKQKYHLPLTHGGGGGGRAGSLYATPPPPPSPRVLKDSGAGSAPNKCP